MRTLFQGQSVYVFELETLRAALCLTHPRKCAVEPSEAEPTSQGEELTGRSWPQRKEYRLKPEARDVLGPVLDPTTMLS